LTAKAKAEAAKIANAEFSPLFTAIADPKKQREILLAPEQVDLARSVEKLIRDVIKAWLTRDLDKIPLPPAHVLTDRLRQGGERVKDSLFARADLIALLEIVTQEQADRVLTAVWEQSGMSALLDPTLAARIRLTRAQQEEILFLLNLKKDVTNEMTEAARPFWDRRLSDPAAQGQIDLLMRDSDGREEQLDEVILTQVLTAPQARSLMRILNGSASQLPRGRAEKATRPRRPSQ
jgi:hypothetical protein